jgi:hypothetical protein
MEMSKKVSWDKVAKQEFDNMSPDEQEWIRDLRATVYGE